MPPRSQQVLVNNAEVVELSGSAGDILTYILSITGETSNPFALPCSDETSVSFIL